MPGARDHLPGNDDSGVLIRPVGAHRGWHLLELALADGGSGADIRVTFDQGRGFEGDHDLYLPLLPGRTIRRVCYLPLPVRAVRIEPAEGGRDSLPLFQSAFHPLAPWRAYRKITQRLVNLHPLFQGSGRLEALRYIKAEAKAAGTAWRELMLARYGETFIRRCPQRNYHQWIEAEELPLWPSDSEVQSLLSALPRKPTILVILRIKPGGDAFLKQSIESVLSQSYPYWKLCLLCPGDFGVGESSLEDKRISVLSCSPNEEFSASINRALRSTGGDFVIVLDSGDLLAKHALLRLVDALARAPECGLIYSDEDRLDRDGNRLEPQFKPDWNPDLLLSQNYIGHLSLFSARLVADVGGMREGMEGNRDYDLLLRCAARLRPEQIVHLPEVLYHKHQPEPEIPVETDPDVAGGITALEDYVKRMSPDVVVEKGILPDTYRARWPVPSPPPLVSLIIPTRDGFEVLQRCVDSILEKTSYPRYEILILDNESRHSETHDYLAKVSRDPRVSVHSWDHPFNYSAINNFGASKANGTVLGLLNNDVEVINHDWLEEMVSQACREEIGCVGAKLYYPNGLVQHAGVILGVGGIAGHSHKYFARDEPGHCARLQVTQNLSAVTGACLLVRRAVFEEVGGLDEELAIAFNDVDFCLRVREAGYRNLWTPYAELYHHESMTRGASDSKQKRRRMRKEVRYMRNRWGELLHNDPAYNPNLTLLHEDFSLK